MAYRLETGRRVTTEVRRIAEAQLARAVAELESSIAQPFDTTLHTARRRIKKALAAVRLLQPARGTRHRRTMRQLERASRLLAPIADSEAVLETFAAVGDRYRRAIPGEALDGIRVCLAQRQHRAMRRARLAGKLAKAAALLNAERQAVRDWRFEESGFRALAPCLLESMRAARRAASVAAERRSVRTYHRWRQRVKTLWLQIRLIQTRCGGRLAAEETRLEALDHCLGEYHNCALLAQVLEDELPTSRQHTAYWLHVIRGHQLVLAAAARRLSRPVHRQKPAAFIRRVRRQWRPRERTVHAAPRPKRRRRPCDAPAAGEWRCAYAHV